MASWSKTVGRGGWRDTDVWLDPAELSWFGEIRKAAQSTVTGQPLLVSAQAGSLALDVVRPRYAPSGRVARVPRRGLGPSRARRLATRFVPTVMALVAVTAGASLLLASRLERPLPVGATAAPVPSAQVVRPAAPSPAAGAAATISQAGLSVAAPAGEVAAPAIHWRRSLAIGQPYAGRLVDGVQLPIEGPGWITWDPVLDRSPDRATRLYGTDALVRLVLQVISEYRTAHPDAAPIVIGDLSRRYGGEIDDHVSHENGLDVDIYYPRLDGRARPPAAVAQIDLVLAQDLLDRFLAAHVQMILIGPRTDLHGPESVVVPYPEHDNHMHVRLAAAELTP